MDGRPAGYRQDVTTAGASGTAATARGMPVLAAGAIWDEVAGPVPGQVVRVKFARCPAGWQASFELTDPAVSDLAVQHRLVAPTLREAKSAVPQAIRFLLGYPVEDCR